MKTIEELLKCFGCKGRVFDKKGNFTKEGTKTYIRMQEFLMDISVLTEISTENIARKLDEIVSEINS